VRVESQTSKVIIIACDKSEKENGKHDENDDRNGHENYHENKNGNEYFSDSKSAEGSLGTLKQLGGKYEHRPRSKSCFLGKKLPC
jgi:hypothetical protein